MRRVGKKRPADDAESPRRDSLAKKTVKVADPANENLKMGAANGQLLAGGELLSASDWLLAAGYFADSLLREAGQDMPTEILDEVAELQKASQAAIQTMYGGVHRGRETGFGATTAQVALQLIAMRPILPAHHDDTIISPKDARSESKSSQTTRQFSTDGGPYSTSSSSEREKWTAGASSSSSSTQTPHVAHPVGSADRTAPRDKNRADADQKNISGVAYREKLDAWSVMWNLADRRMRKHFFVSRYLKPGMAREEAMQLAYNDAVACRHAQYKKRRKKKNDRTDRDSSHKKEDIINRMHTSTEVDRRSLPTGVYWNEAHYRWEAKILINQQCHSKSFRPKDSSPEEKEVARQLASAYRKKLEEQKRIAQPSKHDIAARTHSSGTKGTSFSVMFQKFLLRRMRNSCTEE